MSATTVRDGLFSQLQADSALISEFTAGEIKKGVESIFDIAASTKGLRVSTEASGQRVVDMRSSRVEATYGFLVMAYFYETDPGSADDRKTLYDEIIREAIEKVLDFGIDGLRQDIGQTRYVQHPKIDNLYFVMIAVVARVREIRGAR